MGQEGKDVVWVPTSPELLEKMLDMAKVTPQDFVMDLGSGDGRNIIAAAKRGANGLGVEFNPDMVALSEQLAREAGVSDRAKFVQGDMYAADISKATVLALFLLPHNLEQLQDKFLALPPGTRIVMNTFTLPGWEAGCHRDDHRQLFELVHVVAPHRAGESGRHLAVRWRGTVPDPGVPESCRDRDRERRFDTNCGWAAPWGRDLDGRGRNHLHRPC